MMETHHGVIHRPSTKPRRVQNKLPKIQKKVLDRAHHGLPVVISTNHGERPDSARFCAAYMLALLLENCEYFCMVKYLSMSAIQTKKKHTLWMSFKPSNQRFTQPYLDYSVICTVRIFKVVKCLNDLQIT